MASAATSKEVVPLVGLLRKLLAAQTDAPSVAYLLRPKSVAGTHRRLFNSEVSPLGRYDDDNNMSSSSEDDEAVDDRRRARDFSSGPMLFSSADVIDPFGAPTTLDRLLEAAAKAAGTGSGSLAAARRGWWLAKDDDDAVTLKVPMPGLGKEHVKVWAEQNTLVIKGEDDKELAGDDDDNDTARYTVRVDLLADAFKMDKVRAEMKNGLLKVTVPKVKHEERTDVFHVTVE